MINIGQKAKDVIEAVAAFLEALITAARNVVADGQLSFSDIGVVNDIFKAGKDLWDAITNKPKV